MGFQVETLLSDRYYSLPWRDNAKGIFGGWILKICTSLLLAVALAIVPLSAAVALAEDQPLKDVSGIWSVNMKGTQQVALALHQVGDKVFGSGKSQDWNGALMGSLQGGDLDITITALTQSGAVSTRLSGSLGNNSLSGTFVKADDRGNYDSGMFTAVLINEDTSGYSPAETSVAKQLPAEKTIAKKASSEQSDENQSDNGQSDAQISDEGSTQAKYQVKTNGTHAIRRLGSTSYTDVHSMSGYVPDSLGVGFSGDGTMGVGGASMG